MVVYVLVHGSDHGGDLDLDVYATRDSAAAAAERKATIIARTRGVADSSLWWSSPLRAELQTGDRFAGEHFCIEPCELEEDGTSVRH